jgi:Purple acid Phosphatase, N-terminal domain
MAGIRAYEKDPPANETGPHEQGRGRLRRHSPCRPAAPLLAGLLILGLFTGCGGGSPGGGNNAPPPQPAPVISRVVSGSVTTTGAIITWTTDQAADSQVEYGTSADYGSSTSLDSNMVTSHSVALAGLTSGTTYHYRVKSGNANGDSVSSDYAITTTQITTDVPAEPRTIAIIIGSDVTTLDTGGLVTQLAQTISADYAARAGANDPVVSTTIIPSPGDVLGVLAALQGVDNLWGIMLIGDVPAPWFIQGQAVAQVSYAAENPSSPLWKSGRLKQLLHPLTYKPQVHFAEFRADDLPGLHAFTQAVIRPQVRYVIRKGLATADPTKIVRGSMSYPINAVPLDAPYEAPNSAQYTVASDGSVSGGDMFISTDVYGKKAWLSRIYGTTEQVLQFIQKDLNTRHTNASLRQYGYVRGVWDSGDTFPDYNEYWTNNILYSTSDISYVLNYETTDNTAVSRLQDFEQMLANGTEFVSFFVHGGSGGIMPEGAGEVGTFYSSDAIYFYSSDLLGVPNHARVINLVSCSTGDFLDPNYFAGAALFGGDTLLVLADTANVSVSVAYEPDQVQEKDHMLADGATFADTNMTWQVTSTWASEMFGDPTISLRALDTANRPVLAISTDGVNFSRYHGPQSDVDVPFWEPSTNGSDVLQTVTLRNDGTTNLAVQITIPTDFVRLDGDHPPVCGDTGCADLPWFWLDSPDPNTLGRVIGSEFSDTILTVPPGETFPLIYRLTPGSGFPSGTTLHVSGLFHIQTVDPRGTPLRESDPRLGRVNLYLSGTVTY